MKWQSVLESRRVQRLFRFESCGDTQDVEIDTDSRDMLHAVDGDELRKLRLGSG